MCRYYVVNSESRKVLFGPFEDRRDADRRHYDVCSNGIPMGDGEVKRPKCAVVSEHALTPNDMGNHYCQVEAVKKESEDVAA